MKIDVTKVLKDAYGDDIGAKEGYRCTACGHVEVTKESGLTVGRAMHAAANHTNPQENLAEEANYRLYKIAVKVAQADKWVDLDLKEMADILERSNKLHGRFVYGALRDVMEKQKARDEGADKKKGKKGKT